MSFLDKLKAWFWGDDLGQPTSQEEYDQEHFFDNLEPYDWESDQPYDFSQEEDLYFNDLDKGIQSKTPLDR